MFNNLLGVFVPMERGLWVFGAWYGARYEDNSRYLFEYVKKAHPEIRAVWLTQNPDVLEDVRALGHEVHAKDSLRGYLLTLRAEVCILTHIPSAIWCDVNYFGLVERCRVVQLYHGIHIKKYEISPDKGKIKSRLFEMLFPSFQNYSLAIATSENTREDFSNIFKVPVDKVAVTGYPRTDPIYACRGKGREGRFTVMYAPTWRSNIQEELALIEGYGFDVGRISHFLSEVGAELQLRLHPNQCKALRKDFVREIEDSGNIYFNHSQGIYEAMSGIDALVSDYSSIYLDYLFLDRPIIFAPFDYDDFMRFQGFYYDYNEMTPGPKASDWDEVIACLKAAISNPEAYQADRDRVRRFFYEFNDGNNSQRVFEEISRRIRG
jgi:CDP-glycerol glycerophosphotransferase